MKWKLVAFLASLLSKASSFSLGMHEIIRGRSFYQINNSNPIKAFFQAQWLVRDGHVTSVGAIRLIFRILTGMLPQRQSLFPVGIEWLVAENCSLLSWEPQGNHLKTQLMLQKDRQTEIVFFDITESFYRVLPDAGPALDLWRWYHEPVSSHYYWSQFESGFHLLMTKVYQVTKIPSFLHLLIHS